MVYDRVMRNIQNTQKCIKQMNSFINARFQRKLRIFAENPISGSRFSGLVFHFQGFGSPVPGPSPELVSSLEPGIPPLRSWVSSLGSHLLVGSWVSGLRSHQHSRVSGATFRICRQEQPPEVFHEKGVLKYFGTSTKITSVGLSF